MSKQQNAEPATQHTPRLLLTAVTAAYTEAKRGVFVSLLHWLNSYVIGPVLPIALIGAGLWFLIGMRGYPLRAPRKICAVLLTRQRGSGVSPFRAVTVALAGTLGVGNIAGVATSIAFGGAGAVFWMWVSALAAMVIKYAEIVLAMRHRVSSGREVYGGAMYYMPRWAAILFALLCAGAAFPLGNIIQIRAAADALTTVFPISPLLCGGITAILIFAVVWGGLRGISDMTVALIPLFSLLYIAFSLYIIGTNLERLPAVLGAIFSDALSPDAAFGGTVGFLLSLVLRNNSLRLGVTRGILSNEAGCGTAPIAHAASTAAHPAQQGCWGVFEVTADTVILCTMTAFVILLFPESLAEAGGSGVSIALAAFGAGAGKTVRLLLCLSIFFYAFSSAVCWAYYGLEGIRFLTPSQPVRKLYLLLYSAAACYGAVAAADVIWESADLFTGAMTLLNLVFLCLRHREIERETFAFFCGTAELPQKKRTDRHS